ncbi:MAG: nucleoside triphosphate pyrophosphohydrolase [Candidatus Actinomarina sp.]|tara:strand:- start:1480 stop:2220 length:741 start_codon:yes stop_codon:yes gene_type:complete
MNEFDELVGIVKKLREECPWDMEQTHESLSRHLIEEAYELLDALASIQDEDSNYALVKDELGDLLLQILLHSKIAEEHNHFAIVDVIDSLKSKLIERHPHVFGDVELNTAEEVEKQWETIKQKDSSLSIFEDINSKLPSITRAFKTQRKAKKLNLSYANYDEALEDLLSEVKELEEAEQLEDRKREIGDVIFSIINVCRYLEADPEIQLNKSTQRFIERAQYVEKHIKEDSNLEKLWQEAKKTEEK